MMNLLKKETIIKTFAVPRHGPPLVRYEPFRRNISHAPRSEMITTTHVICTRRHHDREDITMCKRRGDDTTRKTHYPRTRQTANQNVVEHFPVRAMSALSFAIKSRPFDRSGVRTFQTFYWPSSSPLFWLRIRSVSRDENNNGDKMEIDRTNRTSTWTSTENSSLQRNRKTRTHEALRSTRVPVFGYRSRVSSSSEITICKKYYTLWNIEKAIRILVCSTVNVETVTDKTGRSERS